MTDEPNSDLAAIYCPNHDDYRPGCPLCLREWLDRPCPPKHVDDPPDERDEQADPDSEAETRRAINQRWTLERYDACV